MNRRAKNRLAVISFLTVAGATTSPLDWSRVLVAQEAPQREDFTRSLPATPTGAVKPVLTVRVFDYVQVPEAVSNAQEVATRIFHEAGIKVVWHDCMSAARHSQDDSTCARELGPTEVVLRIVLRIKVFPGINHDTNLGFAVGPYATVSFSRVLDLARNQSDPPFLILGRAMAHEIGHSLLRSMAHSPEGIMRAQGGGQNLKVAATNDMFFTRQQSEALQATLLMRASQSGPNQVSRFAAPK
jgi:hypothetical protein